MTYQYIWLLFKELFVPKPMMTNKMNRTRTNANTPPKLEPLFPQEQPQP